MLHLKTVMLTVSWCLHHLTFSTGRLKTMPITHSSRIQKITAKLKIQEAIMSISILQMDQLLYKYPMVNTHLNQSSIYEFILNETI